MIGCLFRLTELDGGAIVIDGINIAKVRNRSQSNKASLFHVVKGKV